MQSAQESLPNLQKTGVTAGVTPVFLLPEGKSLQVLYARQRRPLNFL